MHPYTFISPCLPILILCVWVLAIQRIGQHHQWSAEIQRKMVHVAVGMTAMMLPIIVPDPRAAGCLFVGTIMVMLAFRHGPAAWRQAGQSIHGVTRCSYGDLFLACAIIFLYYRRGTDTLYYIIPLMIITLSDTAAALAGTTYGRRLFAAADGQKSWEGATMFFLTAWLSSLCCMNLIGTIPPKHAVVLSLSIAYIATQVEAYAWNGIDNLFVPVVCYLILYNYHQTAPLTLLGHTIAIACLYHATHYMLRRIHQDTPTHIAYVLTAIVYILSDGWYGTATYACVILLMAMQPTPSWNRIHLGILCSLAMGWLFLAHLCGTPSYPFFYMGTMAYACTYPSHQGTLMRRCALSFVGIIMASLLGILHNTTQGLNPHTIIWICTITILIMAIPLARWPRIQACAAFVIPCIAYGIHLYTH